MPEIRIAMIRITKYPSYLGYVLDGVEKVEAVAYLEVVKREILRGMGLNAKSEEDR